MNNRKVLYTLQKVRQVGRNLDAQKKSTHYTEKDQNCFKKEYSAGGAEGDQLSLQIVTNYLFTGMSLQPPTVMSVSEIF